MTPRVMLVATHREILGGHSVQAEALLERLRSEGTVVSLLPINPRFPARLSRLRRVRYLRTLMNQALYLPSLRRFANFDVAHVFSGSYWSFLLASAPAMLAARTLGRRVVLHYHSGEADDHLERWSVLVHPWLRLAHQIVVPSEYLREVFERHGYRTRVIPNIVDVDGFGYRERVPLKPRLLSTRNLEPYYRIDVILRAFALVRSVYPEATLTVAGYGSEEGRLKRLAASLGESGISFAGRVEHEDMPSLYDRSDIYVNAPVLDNQPVSVLEAFASGLPVVSTSAGDLRFMVRDGETGFIALPEDPEDVARKILLVLRRTDHALPVVRNARRQVEKHLWPRVRNEWAEVYRGSISAAHIPAEVR
jgi:glycosyltransferase involved in cell wall biosynthesis